MTKKNTDPHARTDKEFESIRADGNGIAAVLRALHYVSIQLDEVLIGQEQDELSKQLVAIEDRVTEVTAKLADLTAKVRSDEK